MFYTLGNIATGPRAGMLFVDFTDDRTLRTTGTGEIAWDGHVAEYDGAKRLVEIPVARPLALLDGSPLRWSFDERSPFPP